MAWFYAIPAWLGLLLVIVVCTAIACGGHVLVRRSFPKVAFHEHNEVAGFIVAVAGVLYAVLLGFLTIVVWQHFDETENRAASEADAAVDVWRLSRHLPADEAVRLRTDLGRYVNAIITDEWPRMHHGDSSDEAQRRLIVVIGDIASLRASNPQQANLQGHLLERVQVMADLRRRRINDTKSGIPAILWISLIVGAAVVFGFIYLFGLRNFPLQVGMTGALAILIGASLGVVLELDYPFRGDIAVSPERWIALSEIIAGNRL
jgi:hypothetical protein